MGSGHPKHYPTALDLPKPGVTPLSLKFGKDLSSTNSQPSRKISKNLFPIYYRKNYGIWVNFKGNCILKRNWQKKNDFDIKFLKTLPNTGQEAVRTTIRGPRLGQSDC